MKAKLLLGLLRLSLGWLMLHAGIVKLMDPKWSAAGYIKGAKTLPVFFQSLLDPGVLPIVNLINEWGLTLLGISLILGIGVRISSVLGAVLMLMYYLPGLDFPYPNANSYIVDEHIIYILVLLYFAVSDAGRMYGMKSWAMSKFPRLGWLLA
ncbi:MAG: DoxX family membrane protein [Candidatus Doudnabacteria bacterium]|nr:DoxX family membrane protein [Candidatus Doudnabacteria bacterium]